MINGNDTEYDDDDTGDDDDDNGEIYDDTTYDVNNSDTEYNKGDDNFYVKFKRHCLSLRNKYCISTNLFW